MFVTIQKALALKILFNVCNLLANVEFFVFLLFMKYICFLDGLFLNNTTRQTCVSAIDGVSRIFSP